MQHPAPANAPGPPPAISVVMPVFNALAYLNRSLASLRAQSFLDWELIAVDDASTDASCELLVKNAARDPRIRPFRLPENRGPSAARNHALAQARGEWITYLDADDEYFPDYLGHVYAQRDLAEVLLSPYDLRDDRPKSPTFGQTRTSDPGRMKERLADKSLNISAGLGVAHRRALLDRSGLFNEALRYEEDWDLWRRFVDAGASFAFSSHRSGLYHHRPDGVSRLNFKQPSPGSSHVANLHELKRQGQRAQARQLAQKSLGETISFQDRVKTLEFLQILAVEDKDFEAALRHADELILASPGQAHFHNNRGIVLGCSGRLTEAVLSFTRALELQPGFAEASANLEKARISLARAHRD